MRALRIAVAVLLATLILTGRAWMQDGIVPGNRVIVQDEGTTQGASRTLNCTGAGISCSVTGGVAALNVTGGGGGSSNFLEVSIDLSSGNRLAEQEATTAIWYPVDYIPGSAPAWNDVVWAPEIGLLVAVSGASNTVSTSWNAFEWTNRTPSQNNAWTGVAWSPTLYLFAAVAQDGTNRVMTSPDGIAWSNQTAAEANSWQSVTWSPSLGLYAAVASSGTNRVMTSSNGTTWNAQAAAAAVSWQDVVWAPDLGLFIAVAQSGTAAQQVMTSPNGTTWTSRTAAVSASWESVTWSSEIDLAVAVAFTGEVMTSPDGIVWTQQTVPGTLGYDHVAWSPTLWLFAATATVGVGNDFNEIITSPDGITWTTRNSAGIGTGSGSSFDGLTWAGYPINRFVAMDVGARQVKLSQAYNPVSGFTYRMTVTGQSWVSSTSKIVCGTFGTTADGQSIENSEAAHFTVTVSNRVAGTGFDLTVYNPHGANGTFRFHCTGA